ncbi:MAG: LPS translocon maturation chaperone LptM [bacterium]
MKNSLLTALLAMLLAASLIACGQRGPLHLPAADAQLIAETQRAD